MRYSHLFEKVMNTALGKSMWMESSLIMGEGRGK